MSAFFVFLTLGVIKAHRSLINSAIFKTPNVACVVHWEEEKRVKNFNLNVQNYEMVGCFWVVVG